MKMTKSLLLASASIMVLGLGVSSPAQAFDSVDWNWDKQVTNVENITINVNDTFDWSGLVEIEKIQANIGDVTATSIVTDINNNVPSAGDGNGDGFVTIDDTFHIKTETDDSTNPSGIVATSPELGSNGNLSGEVLAGGTLDEGTDELNIDFHVFGEVPLDAVEVGVNDAIDLPKVESAATAVANNQSIDSSVAVNLHDAQYNFGGFGTDVERTANLQELAFVGAAADQTDNAHTDAVLGLTIAGALGLITPGEVTANSSVTNILNASVDSSATAVGNNLNVNVDPATQGDAFIIADLTQFNYADVTANSLVADVDINGYTNFGGAGFGPCEGCLDGVPQTSLIKSVATAVGNNVSITVGKVGVETP